MNTIRFTIAGNMEKEVPNWLSEYKQRLADIKSAKDQHERESAEDTRESFAKLANQWEPLQNEILRLNNSWQKLEINRIFSDVAEHVFDGKKVSLPNMEKGALVDEFNCVVIKDKNNKEILLIEDKGAGRSNELYWQAFERSGKRITYHNWSTHEIKDCLAKLQQEQGYAPNDLVLSHIERNVEKAIYHSGDVDERSWIEWVPVGKLIMDSAQIKCDYFDIEIPIAEIQDSQALEKILDRLFTQRLKRGK